MSKPETTFSCKNCNDQGWVCENHANMPWGDEYKCCGGAGSPCKICNPCDRDNPPRHLTGSTIIWELGDDL